MRGILQHAAFAAAGLLSLIVVVATDATGQDDPTTKLHPYVGQQMGDVGPEGLVPIYFVMRERLGYDYWFPRVNRMSLADRRRWVMSEAKEHADRVQQDLVRYLNRMVRAGHCQDVSSNWLGNFVQAKAKPSVILAGASLPSVGEVWFDYEPPLSAVEDASPIVLPKANALPVPAAAMMMTPGDGPVAVKADRVWALGFMGQGVTVLNADSGINTGHNDLKGRLWVNAGEIPGNNIDDDNNGFVDDINGWNFGSNNASLSDGGGHGTNTAGCMVADGTCNNTAYGMAPSAKVMTGRLSGEASQWNAIQYAIQMGADSQTSSHSYKNNFNPPPNYKMHRDVGETSLAAGLIRTNSTSNNGGSCGSSSSIGRPFNISAPGNLPPPYIDPNQTLVGRKGGVLGVAAHSTTASSLLSYSPCGPFAWYLPDLQLKLPGYPVGNWDTVNDNDYPYQGGAKQGLLKPDIAAPTGTRTVSSGTCNTRIFSGTSNATPNAMGCLMLWKSANPSLTPEDIAMIVHQTADDAGTVPGKENNWGAGKINALTGVKRALCVHRVNGDPGWTVMHKANTVISMAVDGAVAQPAVIAIGFKRQTVNIGGLFNLGIGATFVPVFVGNTGPKGTNGVSFLVPPTAIGLPFFTQAVIDNRAGVTGEVLTSNVIGITVIP